MTVTIDEIGGLHVMVRDDHECVAVWDNSYGDRSQDLHVVIPGRLDATVRLREEVTT